MAFRFKDPSGGVLLGAGFLRAGDMQGSLAPSTIYQDAPACMKQLRRFFWS